MAALFVQLAIILGAARACGSVFRRFGQPQVCGEIAAGLALGPSLLGSLFPAMQAAVFPAHTAPTFQALSELGLVFLMFFVGLDLQVHELRARTRAAGAISLAGIIVPFVLGLALAEVLHRALALSVDPLGFRLFVGTAVSITAIPVLARILNDLNLQRTRIAALTTTAAALDDVVGWTLLAAVTALVQSRFAAGSAAMRLAATAAFGAAMVWLVRPAVERRCARVEDPAAFDRGGVLTGALIAMLLGAAATSSLGLSSIFGAFTTGIALGGDARVRERLVARLEPVTLTLFLPIFFTYTGLRTEIGSVHGAVPWLLCGLTVAVAIVGKVLGCTAAAASQGLSRTDSWAIGVLMNTRGLMELVVVNIGLDLGVIPRSVFFMLVMMAVITTCMTTPLVRRVLRHSEFESLVNTAAFGNQTFPGTRWQKSGIAPRAR
jgi:Kef-type K+ transport system membrane component KefB